MHKASSVFLSVLAGTLLLSACGLTGGEQGAGTTSNAHASLSFPKVPGEPERNERGEDATHSSDRAEATGVKSRNEVEENCATLTAGDNVLRSRRDSHGHRETLTLVGLEYDCLWVIIHELKRVNLCTTPFREIAYQRTICNALVNMPTAPTHAQIATAILRQL